jgi:hypothetical protein
MTEEHEPVTGGGILGNHMHTVLEVILIANNAGYLPSVKEIEVIATEHEPMEPRYISSMYSMFQGHAVPGEPVTKYLSKTGWITIDADNRISLTKFGRAIAGGTMASAANQDSDYSVSFIPDDPLVYSKLHQSLSTPNRDLLVDPYFKSNFMSFILPTKIRRILIVDKVRGKDNPEIEPLSLALGGLQQQSRNLEIRLAPKDKMHDRFITDTDGSVYLLGSSINGIGKHTSMLIQCPEIIRQSALNEIKDLWKTAAPILPKLPGTQD